MTPFFAYIDPGAGSIIIQIIIAGFLGAFAFFGRIKLFFIKIYKKIFNTKKNGH